MGTLHLLRAVATRPSAEPACLEAFDGELDHLLSTHLPIYNAMAMYRNYDGNGDRVGAFSLGAASPSKGVNVYAASDSPTNPRKVWVMLVNVSGSAQSGLSITFKNFTPAGSALVYRMTNGGAPAPDTAVAITDGTIPGFSLASNAVALLVISR
jgi:hypothetical protein